MERLALLRHNMLPAQDVTISDTVPDSMDKDSQQSNQNAGSGDALTPNVGD
jgi:hypothetical protein